MAKACTFIGNRDLSLNEQWALRPRLQQAILNYLNAGGYREKGSSCRVCPR